MRAMTSIASSTPMLYMDSDVPEGMTLTEWRSHRREADDAGARRSGLARLVRRSRG